MKDLFVDVKATLKYTFQRFTLRGVTYDMIRQKAVPHLSAYSVKSKTAESFGVKLSLNLCFFSFSSL